MNINIISGFLGAGKTTLLNKLLPAFGDKTVVIENEFGEISIDSQRIGSQVPIHEIYAGCICCSLVSDFQQTIKEIAMNPFADQILIEPSGVGQLSDIIRACETVSSKLEQDISIGRVMTVVDVSAYHDDREEFGEFYLDQIRNTDIIFLSHSDQLQKDILQEYEKDMQALNPGAAIYDGEWMEKEGQELMAFINSFVPRKNGLAATCVELPGEHSFASLLIKDITCQDKDQLIDWIEAWNSGEIGKILRVKGNIKMSGGVAVQIDYTRRHCDIKNAEGAEDGLVFIGTHLEKDRLERYLKGGAEDGQDC